MNEDLIELLVAALVYIDIRTKETNPFVKKMGAEDEEQAFKILIDSVQKCDYLFPEIEKLNYAKLAEIQAENDIEQPELPFQKD